MLEGYGVEIIAWWIKNGETAGTDFSLVYTDAQGTRLNFFPNYIVEFTDGTLGLFETTELEEAFFESAETCDVNERKLGALRSWAAAGSPFCASGAAAHALILASPRPEPTHRRPRPPDSCAHLPAGACQGRVAADPTSHHRQSV